MNRRPPAVLERLVSWLVPSGSREHVLGDFSEMYRSPAQYGIEALRTVPILVIHQLRRKWDGVLVAIEACALLMAFQSAWRFDNLPLLRGVSVILCVAWAFVRTANLRAARAINQELDSLNSTERDQ
jgi:hypothetical protein